ncbi:Uncharacterized protein TCM_003073 [Theobroma cacao]|uniref:Uncharacterized protein n=1 Tax=Theobroma cacao TaxID=3641 RepID=A0A061DPK3_THECC|nr:Uncharacterized protein TCM_003073 [Theobroma cacao]
MVKCKHPKGRGQLIAASGSMGQHHVPSPPMPTSTQVVMALVPQSTVAAPSSVSPLIKSRDRGPSVRILTPINSRVKCMFDCSWKGDGATCDILRAFQLHHKRLKGSGDFVDEKPKNETYAYALLQKYSDELASELAYDLSHECYNIHDAAHTSATISKSTYGPTPSSNVVIEPPIFNEAYEMLEQEVNFVKTTIFAVNHCRARSMSKETPLVLFLLIFF